MEKGTKKKMTEKTITLNWLVGEIRKEWAEHKSNYNMKDDEWFECGIVEGKYHASSKKEEKLFCHCSVCKRFKRLLSAAARTQAKKEMGK
ncbi:MAG TPA: hypothetical protein VMW25_00035 [Clostridia bacterium]|nr:hypothetical protein [Clostridia bacterium]